ncbi:FUSC family protein [Curtobacterium sp. RRHDQ10]|uniref:FUSC family protein n=1 Tax=Curtobacterium phyllosphaerae TaxID=3413379 RepID=UPI003BF2BDB1
MRESALRVRTSIPAALQITAATLGAYAFAHVVLGHEYPVLAATTTISTLGFTRDARPVRVLESAVGILVGIVLSELLLLVIGAGVWQIVPFMLLALLVGRFSSRSNAFAAAAATQSILVLFLPVPGGGPFVRSIDGIVGGAVALLATALVPRDPVGLARNDARRVFVLVDTALVDTIEALGFDRRARAEVALDQVRSTQPLLDAWQASLETAVAVARISPWLRGRREALLLQERVRQQVDLAVRNLRVVIRRIGTQGPPVVDRAPIGALLDEVRLALGHVASAVEQRSGGASSLAEARSVLEGVASRLDPRIVLGPESEERGAAGEAVVVLMLRPLVIDLLMATGLSHAEARSRLVDP